MKIYAHTGRAVLCAIACLSLGACATVTRGDKQAWTVQTDPGGAAVRTTVGVTCEQTPCTFKLKRKADFEVTITKAGYKTWTGHVSHQASGAGIATTVAGNAILGGLIGVGVDAATGATLDLKPNPLVVKLEADQPTPAIAETPAAVATPASAPAVAAAPVAVQN
jgi:hypothetical protein